MLIEETVKGRLGVLQRVLSAQELVVMNSFVSVREDLKGF